MDEHYKDMIHNISKGDTSFVEQYFQLPGGRKHLENITLILINALPHHYEEKKALYLGFVEVLDLMQERLRRQKEGAQLLEGILSNG